MFCSKCGKEINDNAAFCDKCGNPTANSPAEDNVAEKVVGRVYISKENSAYISKEKSQKMLAIFAAAVCIITAIIFAITATNNIGAFFTGPRVERLEDIISEEFNGSAVCMLLPAIADIGFYIYAYFNRCFERTFKGTVFTAVIYGVMPLLLAFIMLNTFNEGLEENEYTLTLAFWMMYIILLGVVVYRVIAHKKASEAEEAAVYYEKKDSIKGLKCLSKDNEIVTDWKCKHCGSTNKSGQDYCKDCGKYR